MTFVKVHLRPFTLKSKTTDVAFEKLENIFLQFFLKKRVNIFRIV